MISKLLEMLLNISCGRSYQWKSDRKNGVFDFYYWMQKFQPITLFGWFFLNFKAKIGQKAQKNQKNILKIRISFNIYFWSERLHFFKKKLKSLYQVYSNWTVEIKAKL